MPWFLEMLMSVSRTFQWTKGWERKSFVNRKISYITNHFFQCIMHNSLHLMHGQSAIVYANCAIWYKCFLLFLN